MVRTLFLILDRFKTFIFLVSIVSVFISGYAMEAIMVNENTSNIHLGKHFELFEDVEGKYTIDDLSSGSFDKVFKKSEKEIPNFGLTNFTYWGRFELKNSSTKKLNLYVKHSFTNLHYIDFYYRINKEGNFKTVKTGILKDVNSREFQYNLFVFNLIIPPEKTVECYVKIKTESTLNFDINLLNRKCLLKTTILNYFWWGIFFGSLIIIFLYNLFLYFSTKDRNYLLYIIFLVFIIIDQFALKGFTALYIFPQSPIVNLYIIPYMYLFILASAIIYTISFLNTRIYVPRLHKIFLAYTIVTIIVILFIPVLGYLMAIKVLNLLMTVFTLIFFASILTWKKGYRPARYFFIAWFVLIVTVFLRILTAEGMIPSNIVTSQGYQVGILLQVLFTSLALADKINIMKTETEDTHNKLKRERDLNKELLQTSPAFIIVTDNQGNILMINDLMLKATGYSRDEVIGNSYFEKFIPYRDRKDVLKSIDIMLKSKKIIQTENHLLQKDGNELLVEWHLSKLYNSNGEFDLLFGIGVDITENRKIQEELRQSQKMETVGTLAGGLAHDFNNVLGGITGTLSIIKYKRKNDQGMSEEELDSHLDTIGESSERAVDMVKQLLTLSRKHELSFAIVDLNVSITNVIKICENTIDKSVKLKAYYLKMAATVKADPTQIEQIILNFCINAGHAMTLMRAEGEKWGGFLSISIKKILVDKHFLKIHSEADEIDYWMVSVEDSGVGMTDETLTKIFNPFFTTKKKGVGTGLGLSMVYNIIKQHNGFIEVYSEKGLGSTFNMYLPVLDEGISSKKNSNEKRIILKGEGLILIIDDEKVMRDTAREILEECGYDTIVAENGKEGVEIFKREFKNIKAVVLDMAMPEMAGDDAYFEMKEINANVKVLLASGFKQDERVQRVLNGGVDEFIQKPYTLESLVEKINKVLK